MMASHRSSQASRRTVEETARLYADLFSKSLDERQLSRPTFKFIQEITKNLITETRTLRNVFNPSDFETENKAWDRRRKCEFIQRLIDFVANHKQPVVGCVADKLVAGLDPNKANELLQSLARIAQSRLSGQDTSALKRPRTFTRQSPSSVSPPSRPNDVRGSLGRRLSSSESKNASSVSSSPQKNSSRKVSSTRDSSAGSIKRGSVTGVTSQLTGSPTFEGQPSANVPLSTAQGTGSELPRRASSNLSRRAEPFRDDVPERQAEKKAPRKDPVQPQQEVVVSESDINKNIQQLRNNLEQLRSSLSDFGQLEAELKSKLTEVVDYSSRDQSAMSG